MHLKYIAHKKNCTEFILQKEKNILFSKNKIIFELRNKDIISSNIKKIALLPIKEKKKKRAHKKHKMI